MAGPITYCTNSTITEAWALVQGSPSRIEKVEEPAIARQARKHLPHLVHKDAVVAVKVEGGLAPPFWTSQVGWDRGPWLARFGHRYLSVHWVRQGEIRYTTYEEAIRPAIHAWLRIVPEADEDLGAEAVERIGFGYINTFEFPSKDFDLSQHFKLNIGIDVGQPAPGVTGLETKVQFLDDSSGAHLLVRVLAESPVEATDAIRVRTTVFCERRGVDGVRWRDGERIGDLVHSAKQLAKTRFFDFATPETHTLMGARTDVPPS